MWRRGPVCAYTRVCWCRRIFTYIHTYIRIFRRLRTNTVCRCRWPFFITHTQHTDTDTENAQCTLRGRLHLGVGSTITAIEDRDRAYYCFSPSGRNTGGEDFLRPTQRGMAVFAGISSSQGKRGSSGSLVLLLLVISAPLGRGLLPVPRRSILAAPLLASSRSARPAAVAAATASSGFTATTGSLVSLSSTQVLVNGLTIPVAIWAPASSTPIGQRTETYAYTISIGRIAARLGVNWLTWLPAKQFSLAPAGTDGGVSSAGPGAGGGESSVQAGSGDALIFAHGFLGNTYTYIHIVSYASAPTPSLVP